MGFSIANCSSPDRILIRAPECKRFPGRSKRVFQCCWRVRITPCMGVSENRGTSFWCPYNKDPTIQGTRLGSPIFGHSHIVFGVVHPRNSRTKTTREFPKIGGP